MLVRASLKSGNGFNYAKGDSMFINVGKVKISSSFPVILTFTHGLGGICRIKCPGVKNGKKFGVFLKLLGNFGVLN